MKIAFFETKNWEKRPFKKLLRSHRLDFYNDPLSVETVKLAKPYTIISTSIYSKVDKKVLSQLPNLKLIATRSTGFDHIDIKECKKRGIRVANVPSYGENTVAEHTFALILSLSRKMYKSCLKTLRNDFSIDESVKGFDLYGKTLGVIGAGKIGLHVVRIAKGFGMKVLVYDKFPNKFLSEVLGFEYAPFDEVLKKSDILTLHVPYTKETHHLINMKNISKIKKGAILINTSRGSVVETDALIYALDKGILSGLGLDVLEGEELIKEEKQLLYDTNSPEKFKNLIKDHIILGRDNVIFTPHIAFYSEEALQRIIITTAENIISFIDKSPKNLIV